MCERWRWRMRRRAAVGGTHVVGPGLDLLVKLVLVLVPEGGVAHQQDVQDHTCHTHQARVNILHTFAVQWKPCTAHVELSIKAPLAHCTLTLSAVQNYFPFCCVFIRCVLEYWAVFPLNERLKKWPTDHRPICPLASHRDPSSTPLGTNILEFQQNLENNTKHHKSMKWEKAFCTQVSSPVQEN